jgi:hypothetical protein
MSVTKTCKIHGELTQKDIKSGIYRGKKYVKCRPCEIERSRKYHAKKYQDEEWVKEKHKRDQIRWETKKEEITKKRQTPEAMEKRRASYARHNELYRESYIKKQRNYRENLHDSYIKRLVRNGKKEADSVPLPQSMIDFKKVLITAKRRIKELRNKKVGEDFYVTKKY